MDLAALERADQVLERRRIRGKRPAVGRNLGDLRAAVFTNAEQVRTLFAVAASIGKAKSLEDSLNRTLVASIGPVASAALRNARVTVGLESSPPKLGALISALDTALS